jgi:hypothetical protein
MKKVFQWIKDNPNRTMFLVPILLVAGISISHVVSWYDIANPINWAIYLSIAIEVGAMTALVAATNRIKGGVWFMFILVTIIQMIGNIFFSFKEIDANGELFKSWMELTGPLWEMLGSDPTDISSQKRWLAFLEGGLLPIISLTSLHFFTKYDSGKKSTESEVVTEKKPVEPDLSQEMSEEDYEEMKQKFIEKKLMEERDLKYKPTMSDIEKFEKFLKDIEYSGPKFTENEVEKFTPNEEELENIEKILNQYGKPNVVEIQEEPIVTEEPITETQIEEEPEEEISKVFFEPEETEVLYSDDDTKEEIAEEAPQETIEEVVKPEPIEMGSSTKILNYFKRND